MRLQEKLAGVLLAGAVALTGCTAVQPDAGGSAGAVPSSTSSTPDRSAVTLTGGGAPPTVLTGDAGSTSVAASAALFTSSPVAVVAYDGGAAVIERAAAAAVDLGVPVLAAGSMDLQPELDRLGAGTVLVFGAPPDGWEPIVGNRTVVPETDPDQLPPFDAAADPAAAVVLTAGTNPAHAAAAASARAAGAEVLALGTPDPRADPAAIAALKRQPERSVIALGEGFGTPEALGQRTQVARTAPELPGGGQTVFPGRRMVALYGHPGGGALGVLGEQDVDAAIQRAKEQAQQYQQFSAEPVVPAFEIITTVASSEAGPDGDYSSEATLEHIRPWVEAAESAGVYVVLDLQPGTTDFLAQAQRYEELLKRPHVGLALDPEWRLSPGQRHMEQIGSVDATEVNRVATWLADLTRDNNLPQKVFMLHQFSLAMVGNRPQVDTGRSELAMVVHADGHGDPGQKMETWNALRADLPANIWMGWKNFLDEDTPTFTPAQTFNDVAPKPWFVSYQ
jgi:hypothetical protein